MKMSMCSSRTLLFILGLLFLAATVATWGISGYVLATYKQISTFATAYFTWMPSVVMIFVGIIFLIAGVSGCATACTGKRSCSFMFFLFVFLTFISLITSMALVFVYKRQISDTVQQETNRTFDEYGRPGEGVLTSQVDFVQSHLFCCGSENYSSWEQAYWGRTGNRSHLVPLSCCKNFTDCKNGNLDLMRPSPDHFIYNTGCVVKVEQFLQTHLRYLAGGTIGFLLVLLLGMVASCVVLCKKEENPYFSLA